MGGMQVPAIAAARLVLRLEERALGDQNLRLDDLARLKNRPDAGVAEVCHQRHLQRVLNLHAFALQLHQLLAGTIMKLGLQLLADADAGEAQRRPAVMRAQGANRKVLTDLVHLARQHRHQRVGRVLPLDALPAFQKLIDRP